MGRMLKRPAVVKASIPSSVIAISLRVECQSNSCRATVLIAQRYVDNCRCAREFAAFDGTGPDRCRGTYSDEGEWPGADPAAAVRRQSPRGHRTRRGPRQPGLPRAGPDAESGPQSPD